MCRTRRNWSCRFARGRRCWEARGQRGRCHDGDADGVPVEPVTTNLGFLRVSLVAEHAGQVGCAKRGGSMKSEQEKMLAGELYDPLDRELAQARQRARDL